LIAGLTQQGLDGSPHLDRLLTVADMPPRSIALALWCPGPWCAAVHSASAVFVAGDWQVVPRRVLAKLRGQRIGGN
jgi:hypothetical protein